MTEEQIGTLLSPDGLVVAANAQTATFAPTSVPASPSAIDLGYHPRELVFHAGYAGHDGPVALAFPEVHFGTPLELLIGATASIVLAPLHARIGSQ